MRTYVITVMFPTEGGGYAAFVANNDTLENFILETEVHPPFLSERIALVQLMEPTKNDKEESSVGRRINEHMLHVFVNRSEFLKLKRIYRSAK